MLLAVTNIEKIKLLGKEMKIFCLKREQWYLHALIQAVGGGRASEVPGRL